MEKNKVQCNNGFDLLVFIDDIPQRLPFAEGKKLNPVAIFPFNDSFYIELKETEVFGYPINFQERLPSVENFNRLSDVISELNERLQELGAPVLGGSYWLNDGSYTRPKNKVYVGKIICLDKGNNSCQAGNKNLLIAKVRLTGHFYA